MACVASSVRWQNRRTITEPDVSVTCGPDEQLFGVAHLQRLMEARRLPTQGSVIHTVLAEMCSNALEYGVLGLDSRLKRDAEGISRCYQCARNAWLHCKQVMCGCACA